jgi:hypothetical protein
MAIDITKLKSCFHFALTFFISGCGIGHSITTPNGHTISNDVKFNLKGKFRNFDTTILSINKCYIMSCGNWKRGFKFFGNGQVAELNFPESSSQETIIRSRGGYYIVTGNEVIIEMSYGVSLGMISGDDWGIALLK